MRWRCFRGWTEFLNKISCWEQRAVRERRSGWRGRTSLSCFHGLKLENVYFPRCVFSVIMHWCTGRGGCDDGQISEQTLTCLQRKSHFFAWWRKEQQTQSRTSEAPGNGKDLFSKVQYMAAWRALSDFSKKRLWVAAFPESWLSDACANSRF